MKPTLTLLTAVLLAPLATIGELERKGASGQLMNPTNNSNHTIP